ncbi:hypothetical protein CEXT_84601 [Caerostris extrusa]|uniref:Uncharacterized protein n=1 Tax=Caerostris extrusa TaxID=172846 RepID=A0AAV4NV64_CAEEX|nr:hypothetical protein CEXT_84601 [Caerostris extrusa]
MGEKQSEPSQVKQASGPRPLSPSTGQRRLLSEGRVLMVCKHGERFEESIRQACSRWRSFGTPVTHWGKFRWLRENWSKYRHLNLGIIMLRYFGKGLNEVKCL